jgi:hypothetical protein
VFASFFRDASLGIKSVADAKIGGAVLCWGPLDGYAELSQWNWLTSLIDACTHIKRSPPNPRGSNALDFVDFHAYGDGEENANRILSEIHMVAAYADSRHALHMPCAITETSVALASRADWTNRSFHFGHRTLPRLRQIMSVLAHPDKMLVVQEHDLSAGAGGQFSFIGAGHNLSTMSNATPEMEMFRALKPLRGTRLDRDLLGLQDATMDAAAEVVWNGDLGVFGAIVVAVANFGSADLTVEIQLEDTWAQSIDKDLAPWMVTQLDAVSLRAVPFHSGSMQLLQTPSEGLSVLTIPLVRWHEPTKTNVLTEAFSRDVGVAIDNSSSSSSTGRTALINTTVTIPDDLRGMSQRLRFGVKGPAVACSSWALDLDGYKMQWAATQEFRGGGCRANPSSGINCSKHVAAGMGVSYAEIDLGSWALPPVPPPKQCEILEGVHWGGAGIAIDPWEAYAYKGINASQCCKLCRGTVGPACVAFTLTGGGKDTKCTLLSSRLPDEDEPAKAGATVVSGAPVRRQTRVTLQASCSTPATGATRVPLSYLTFLSLVLKTDDEETKSYSVMLTTDALEVNGVSHVEAQIFGVTAYETHGDYFWQEPELGGRWLAEWGVEAIGIGNMDYPLPPGCSYNSTACPVVVSGHPGDRRDLSAHCPGPNFNETDIRKWYDDPGPGGAKRWFYKYPSMQSGSNGQMFGNMLKTIRAGGAEPFVYLEYSLPGDMSGCGKGHNNDIQAGPPKNATLWGVAAAAYLNLARTADPDLHLAHLTNEPNSNWFRNSQHMVADFAAFFPAAAAVIKREVPGMQLGGPVLCWPVSESWGWIPELIDSSLPSGLLDFIDFHA